MSQVHIQILTCGPNVPTQMCLPQSHIQARDKAEAQASALQGDLKEVTQRLIEVRVFEACAMCLFTNTSESVAHGRLNPVVKPDCVTRIDDGLH